MKAFVLTMALLLPVQVPQVRPCRWAQPVLQNGPDNFYMVDDGVYRSAQPDRADMVQLVSMGFKTILNLRDYHSDEAEAKGLNLQLERLEMSAGDIHTGDVVKALRILTHAEKPVLVHCWHGSDRTGLVCAMYRMVIQGWSREDAIEELMNGGYGFHGSFYDNIPAYLQQVNVEEIRKQVNNR